MYRETRDDVRLASRTLVIGASSQCPLNLSRCWRAGARRLHKECAALDEWSEAAKPQKQQRHMHRNFAHLYRERLAKMTMATHLAKKAKQVVVKCACLQMLFLLLTHIRKKCAPPTRRQVFRNPSLLQGCWVRTPCHRGHMVHETIKHLGKLTPTGVWKTGYYNLIALEMLRRAWAQSWANTDCDQRRLRVLMSRRTMPRATVRPRSDGSGIPVVALRKTTPG